MAKRDDSALLPVKQLRTYIDYNQETGVFLWRYLPNMDARRNSRFANKPAGTINLQGYLAIQIEKRIWYGHRIAWALTHGAWPADSIDHINGNTTDNRLVNLRSVTHHENMMNRKTPKHNTTGFKGVSLTRDGNYRATIHADGEFYHLGTFRSAEAAHAAYCEAAVKFHGEFASNGVRILSGPD